MTEDQGGEVFFGDNLSILRALATAPSRERDPRLPGPAVFDQSRPSRHQKRARPWTTGGASSAFDDRWTDRAAYLEPWEAPGRGARAAGPPWFGESCTWTPRRATTSGDVRRDLRRPLARQRDRVALPPWPSKTRTSSACTMCLLRYRRMHVWRRDGTRSTSAAASTVGTWGVKSSARSMRKADAGHGRPTTGGHRRCPVGGRLGHRRHCASGRERTGYPSKKPEALLDAPASILERSRRLGARPYAEAAPPFRLRPAWPPLRGHRRQ